MSNDDALIDCTNELHLTTIDASDVNPERFPTILHLMDDLVLPPRAAVATSLTTEPIFDKTYGVV